MLPLNEDMLKYKQYAGIAVPMEARITVSAEKWVCTHTHGFTVFGQRKEREIAMLLATLVVCRDF